MKFILRAMAARAPRVWGKIANTLSLMLAVRRSADGLRLTLHSCTPGFPMMPYATGCTPTRGECDVYSVGLQYFAVAAEFDHVTHPRSECVNVFPSFFIPNSNEQLLGVDSPQVAVEW